MSKTLDFTVRLVPPSDNLYKRIRIVPVKGKMLPTFYHTAQAKAWWKAVASAAGGARMTSELYRVAFIVYFPPRSRMDLDNANKCIMDGLKHAGVIRDDRYVVEAHAYKVKVKTEAEAKTEIFVRAAGQLDVPGLEDWQ